MKKFIETLQNIYRIEELRNRIGITIALIFIYRVGSYISLPGINPLQLDQLSQSSGEGVLALVNLFAGGAFGRASVFALGIMPYISASIAMQLLSLGVPYFQKLQKEGESGRRTINQITRYLTVVVTAFQSIAYLSYIGAQAGPAISGDLAPWLFKLTSVVILTTGTLFTMWLGERITEKGIGNGISLLITVGIIANLPAALVQEFGTRLSSGGLIVFVIEIAALLATIVAVVLLVQGTRRIPVQYAKRNVMQRGRMMQAGGVRQYLPLKVNAAGVMPIIFAQALMFLPATLIQFAPESIDRNSGFLVELNNPTSFWYNFIYFFMVVAFTYLYTALTVNPRQMADDMKKNGGFIPGVKPGKKTADFIDNVISRITLPGSLFLGLVSIMPAFAMIAGVDTAFAYFFGGTSLLIMVGVVLDTLQQIESHLLMRQYDGLTKSGRIKGRNSDAYRAV